MEFHLRRIYVLFLSFLIILDCLSFELAPDAHDKQLGTCGYPELSTTPSTSYQRIQNL